MGKGKGGSEVGATKRKGCREESWRWEERGMGRMQVRPGVGVGVEMELGARL